MLLTNDWLVNINVKIVDGMLHYNCDPVQVSRSMLNICIYIQQDEQEE
jgi:hypothetical protein